MVILAHDNLFFIIANHVMSKSMGGILSPLSPGIKDYDTYGKNEKLQKLEFFFSMEQMIWSTNDMVFYLLVTLDVLECALAYLWFLHYILPSPISLQSLAKFLICS